MKKTSVSVILVASGLLGLLGATGCGRKAPAPEQPVVQKIETQPAGLKPSVAPEQSQVQAVNVRVTLSKDILNQEFLYGADLQYSSYYDKDMDLYNQSIALGHIPVRFRVAGDELELVADNKRLYPSQVNHPEQLITRYKIVDETGDSYVISGGNSGDFLAELFVGTYSDTAGGFTVASAPPPRDLWVRSFETDNTGSMLLQQTSVVLSDGTIGEFMESVMPRSRLTPGASFEKFKMNPDDPVGGSDGAVARYRFLQGEKNFDGEDAVAYAQHYDLSPNEDGTPATIDWYVTPNIPDEDLEPVKEAVEGWNRYFRAEKGIERDVMQFKGRLPQGIHLGDPRYNVINWDSRLVAGAAYESQASDPASGKQSHSLIYMPAAWLKIGTDYWKTGQVSDVNESVSGKARASMKGVLHSARIACVRDMRAAAAELASGRLAKGEVDTFGVELLKQTLFHEVGHALGLAHNFKGSLSFDRSKPDSMFSSSIMDYNDFEIERGAFKSATTSDGPLLEYDRQAIDALYDKSQDVKDSDPTVPACNDNEADNEDGGVDPLCIRYDIEKDPTLSVNTAFARVTKDTLDRDVTLSQAIARVPALALSDDALKNAKDADGLKTLAKNAADALVGSVRFYYLSGKASISRVVRTNVKSLLQFEDGILPDGYDELAMRERAFAGVQQALALKALPDNVSTALVAAEDQIVAKLGSTSAAQALSADDRTKTIADLKKTLTDAVSAFATDTANGLPKLRASVLTSLARHTAVPYFFGNLDAGKPTAAQLDYETSIVGVLGDSVVATDLTKDERVAAATSLVSFKGRSDLASSSIDSARQKLKAELAVARDNKSRETAEAILTALSEDKAGN